MALDPKAMSAMNPKQKVTAILIVVIVLFLIWQVISMFSDGSGSEAQPATPPPSAANGNGKSATPGQPAPQQQGPLPSQLPTVAIPRDQQMEMMRLQQETQARYITQLNELQLLKIAKDIADVSKDIAAAKLAMINSQKEIVDKLTIKQTPESQIPYGQNLAPTNPAAPPTISEVPKIDLNAQVGTPQATYTVISVSQLMGKWSAVIGSQGKLYSVTVGDVLPTDGSVVKSINRSGVTLEKNGTTRKVSMVPLV